MLTAMQRTLAASVCVVTIALAPAVARAETLADALISAYRHSNLLEQNRALLRVADEDVAVQLAALRPTLNFIANFDYNDPLSAARVVAGAGDLAATFSLQASLTVFSNGQRGLALEAAKESVLATREALVNIEQSVLLTAVQAFFDVRSAVAFLSLRQSNTRLIQQELRAAQDRFEVGEVTRTDVALAESRLAAARSQLAAAQGDLAVAREAYNAAVGRFPGNLRAPSSQPKLPKSVDAAKNLGVRNHPQVRQSQREVTVAQINADIAERAAGPTVNLNATQSVTDLGDQSFNFGIDVTQPIYAGGRLPALERQALARRDAARSSLHETVLLVEQSVGNAWAQLEIAGAQIRAADEQIRAAQVAFDGTREEARLGARTTLDVLDAEQELLDARANRIDADNQRSVAVYQLLSAMGLLTVEHLKLGITTYDPTAYYNAVKKAPVRHSKQGERLDRVLKSISRD